MSVRGAVVDDGVSRVTGGGPCIVVIPTIRQIVGRDRRGRGACGGVKILRIGQRGNRPTGRAERDGNPETVVVGTAVGSHIHCIFCHSRKARDRIGRCGGGGRGYGGGGGHLRACRNIDVPAGLRRARCPGQGTAIAENASGLHVGGGRAGHRRGKGTRG